MDKTNYHKTYLKDFQIEKEDMTETINKIKISTEILDKAKRDILTKGFRNEQEEIVFFKKTKPFMLANILYYKHRYQIVTCKKFFNDISLIYN